MSARFGVRRARALPYDAPGTARSGPPPDALSVVVPVHGAPDDFRRCLKSLRRHQGAEQLVIVLDGPGQTEAEAALAEGDVTVLRHAERRGFVAAVRTGIAAVAGDVILLNSDTVVTHGWAAKLRAAAYSHEAVATVTPFSNDATLCSLPRPFETNALPAGHDVDSFARVVEDNTSRAYPFLPTGMGFCLYVKRAALDAVGGFDPTRFGLGYGEEVDFCFRAVKAGWRHVLDDATFVLHAGQRSFGTARRARVRAAERIVRRLHPEYVATIARFMREDPLARLRERVVARLRPVSVRASPPPPVLHVVHGWPPYANGGTEVYARGLAVRQALRREVAVYARIEDPTRATGDAIELLDNGARVRLVVNNFTQRNPLARNALYARALQNDFARFVDAVQPALVHVHHLSGHAVGLTHVPPLRRVPYVFQLQDWWAACARANLLRPDGTLCAGPGAVRCSRCLPLTRLPLHTIWNPLLHTLRRRMLRRAIDRAALVIAGSRFAEESARAMGILGAATSCRVVPYGVELPRETRSRVGTAPLRFGFVGTLMPHKGAHLAVAAFRSVDPSRASLDVWGRAPSAFAAKLHAGAGPAVRFRGTFLEKDKDDVFAALDVLIVPSLGFESFGIAPREAMSRGVPVLASARSALLEAFTADQGGFFDPDDPRALAGWIERLIAQPAIVDEWRGRLPTIKGMDAHAAEIEAIYEELRGAARP